MDIMQLLLDNEGKHIDVEPGTPASIITKRDGTKSIAITFAGFNYTGLVNLPAEHQIIDAKIVIAQGHLKYKVRRDANDVPQKAQSGQPALDVYVTVDKCEVLPNEKVPELWSAKREQTQQASGSADVAKMFTP